MLSVILKDSVRNLGKAGEVTKVKPGYARYLLAQQKAVRATKENLDALKQKYLLIEEENLKKLNKAQEVRAALEGKYFTIVRQASDDNKLFGSVTIRDIAKLLCHHGYEIKSKDVFFNGAIKYLGEYLVNVELHADLVIQITLYVVRNESDVDKIRRSSSINKEGLKISERLNDSGDNEKVESEK